MQKILRKFEPIDFPPPSMSDIKDAEILKNMKDSEIDFSDIPEQSQMSTRRYYQNSNFVEIDEDILKKFMQKGSDYIKRINFILRNAAACL